VDGTDTDLADSAIRRAFDAHHVALFRLALVLTRDPYEAEDIVQDVFIKTGQKLVALPEDDVGRYLRASVVNAYRSKLRRLRVQARRLTSLTQPAMGIDRDESQDLWRAVVALPPRQRVTVVLRYYEDLSTEETAAIMRCSVGTVKSQLSRAIAQLRRGYDDEDRG
jgi:RNA polymerase sigma factor (sigma-70 family)